MALSSVGGVMNINEALKVLGIEAEYTPDSIKLAYRKLCAVYHPDRNPAGLEMMKMVNEAYTALKDESGTADNGQDIESYGADIYAALQAIVGLDGLNIEVAGTWVWVSGDTKKHKETLKQSGFLWAMKKKMWFYRPADSMSKGRGKYSIDDIRARHGSQTINKQQQRSIAA